MERGNRYCCERIRPILKQKTAGSLTEKVYIREQIERGNERIRKVESKC